jgi:hypothetical protein
MNCKCGQIASECDCSDAETEETVSISPISVSPQANRAFITWQSARRRIDFSVSPPSSPRRIEPVAAVVVDEVAKEEKAASAESFIGECAVCYCDLPAHSNHVATVCGHLFCVKCLLKWHLSATTCPICRTKLYDDIDTYEYESEEIVESWGSVEPPPSQNQLNAYLREDIEWTGNVDEDDRINTYSQSRIGRIQEVRNQFLLELTTDDTETFRHVLIRPHDYLDIACGPDRYFEFVMMNGSHYFGTINTVLMIDDPLTEYCFEMMNNSMIACFHPDEHDRTYFRLQTSDSQLLPFNQIQRVYLIQPIIRVD